MTIREVINVLIDAPDKEKPFIVECRTDVFKNHDYEWGWGQLEVTKIVNCTHSSVAEAEEEKGENNE